MSVPASVEELLNLIRKSGMVEDTKLNAYLARRQSGRGLPAEAQEAAEAMVNDGLITNFQAEQYMLGKWRGFTIGKYKLLERVGVGGMGQVFLCEHMFMKRRVAVKVLPPAKAEQPAALGRFYREARAAGSIEHPNIVRTHDIDQDGNLHFIVMEYVDGSNLLDIVKKHGPLHIGRAVSYIRQTAIGLEFAFQGGIIHRDIKPGNVLVDRYGNAKLLDMGLARFYNDNADNLTQKYDDKIVLGTADYVAPEQVANSHAVDIRADIYALGASMYFMLAGHPAFPNGTVSQKLLWHRTKDPTPIRQIRQEIPEGLATIVEKMMKKDPAARYQTPMEVAIALEKYLPEEVPLPPVIEMPSLSSAALEGAEPPPELNPAPKPLDVPATPLSEFKIKPKPFAPKQSPFGPSVAVAEKPRSGEYAGIESEQEQGGVAVATLPTVSLKAKPRPAFAPSSAAAPQQESAKPKPANMTLPPTLPAPASPLPGTFPVIAVAPSDKGPRQRKGIFFALIGASALVALGLVGWKVTAKPKPAPQAQVEENK
jgi:serine/threonine protein kinase